MKYQANPVVVDASRIVAVKRALPSGHVGLELEHGGWHLATPEQMSRMKPSVGDFVVMQSDGYVYLNPADVFLRKYRPLDLSPAVEGDGIVITREGNIIGRPEVIEEFTEFCKARGKLLS